MQKYHTLIYDIPHTHTLTDLKKKYNNHGLVQSGIHSHMHVRKTCIDEMTHCNLQIARMNIRLRMFPQNVSAFRF